MSWWSYTVLGGDTPLNIECNFLYDVCEIDPDKFFDEDNCDLSLYKDIIEKHTRPYADRLMRGLDTDIAFQVLGTVIIRSGASLPADIKKAIIEFAETDSKFDNNERRAHMKTFIHQLENYDETPTPVHTEYLFDKFFKALQGGKEQLMGANV